MKTIQKIISNFAPPPRLKVSEWADNFRKLSPESSAEPGQWRTSRAEYQREIMDAVNDPSVVEVVVMSSAQIGKALAVNTPIPTVDGWVTMGEIKAGDMVFDEKGCPCQVTFATDVMLDRKCYKVVFSDGSEMVADADHRWLTEPDYPDAVKSAIYTTEEIRRSLKYGKNNHRNNHAIPVAAPLITPINNDLPIDPYVLGVWLGDGNSYSTQITIHKDDLEVAEYIKDAGVAVVIRQKDKKNPNTYNLLLDPYVRDQQFCIRGHDMNVRGKTPDGYCRECCNQSSKHRQYGTKRDPVINFRNTISTKLTKLGLLKEAKRHEENHKHIPRIYLRASFSQRLALLQGLMDTDGYCCGKSGRQEFSTTSGAIAEGFYELLMSLGIKATVREKIPITKYKGEVVEGKKAYIFSFLVYREMPIFRLRRKLEKMVSASEGKRRVSETTRRRITDIIEVDSVPVRCISVDSPSHLYLAGKSMIPTHNTETLGNVVAYYITQDPSPMLLLQPTLEMSEAYSKDRLAPMVRDCPNLLDKIGDPRSRKTDNTLLHKTFPGGHITLAGANSPASLASRPVRIVLCDEVDRYPASAGTEGDPVNLARKRTVTFWNRKLLLTSTPTVKGNSRIEQAFLASDQRRFFVGCPYCGHEQVLIWAGVKWEDDPKAAWYECGNCNRPINNGQKLEMIRMGRWKATAEFKGVAGFHLNELYSPWRTFGDVASDFLKAKDNPQQLKVWVNTSLGETWDDQQGETPEFEELAARAENYSSSFVPRGGLFLTAGVDVQADRLAVVVKAWGRGEESWLIYWGEIYGDPTVEKVWQDLDGLLTLKFEHELRTEIGILCTAIDSGFKPQEVYQFVRSRKYKTLATKGMSTPGKAVLGRATYQDVNYKGQVLKKGVQLFPIGTDVAKSVVYSRMKIGEGAGVMHFPQGLDDSYYMQLTAEKLVTKFNKGVPVREWVKVRARNEALDCEVLAYAAALAVGLNRANWEKLEAQLLPKKDEPETPMPAKKKPSSRGTGFVGEW